MEMLFVFLLYFGLSYLVANYGRKRKIGFGWAFALSLILGPLIGFIITLLSKENKSDFKVSSSFSKKDNLFDEAEIFNTEYSEGNKPVMKILKKDND